MDSKDEYIGSLLLSLFLMQIEINRLNQTLELARRGELVYIKNPQIEKLKVENTRLGTYLQEIKEIVGKECKDCLDKINNNCWICSYYPILELITKMESEG